MTVNDVLFIAKKIGIAYTEVCRPMLEEFDLPQPALDIILFLHKYPEHNFAKDISAMRFLKPNVVSLHIDKLVKEGYIERRTVEGDRRKIQLYCTDKALPVIEKGLEIQNGFISNISDGLSQEDLDTFCSFLSVIGENADKISSKR